MAQMTEYLTTKELATLLRIKERKVYDLAASGEVPCTKVTGKLLFPEQEVRAWLTHGRLNSEQPDSRPSVFLGSHDPLLDWALRESQCGLASYFDGSLDGLKRFNAGEGIACGMHLYSPEANDWNKPAVSDARVDNAVLIRFAKRQRGLILQANSEIRSIEDLAGHRFVPRQASSGAQTSFNHLLARAAMDTSDLQLVGLARTEADAVLSVAQDQADAAFGLAALAQQQQLKFLLLLEESFDLLIDRKAYFDPAIQRFLEFCRSDSFQDRASQMQGYSVQQTGLVCWNA